MNAGDMKRETELRKINENHDDRGRFSSGAGGTGGTLNTDWKHPQLKAEAVRESTPSEDRHINDHPHDGVSKMKDFLGEVKTYYRNGNTIAIHDGDVQNGEAWVHEGLHTADAVREAYERGLHDDFDADNPDEPNSYKD